MIFPIFSVLRRSCSSLSYIDQPELSFENLQKVALLNKSPYSLKKSRTLQIYELAASGDPKTSAIEISKVENKIWEELNLGGKIYSIFVGPEDYQDNKRFTRIGIVLGLHRIQ